MKTINIGLIGVGLDTYWKQFEGLEDRLIGYQEEIAERMRNMDANIINIPIIDNQVKAKNRSEEHSLNSSHRKSRMPSSA